ncbi:MAG: substrate-binding domain-containing protein [Dorea sp.]
MMNKKMIAVMIAMTMIVSLAACGNSQDNSDEETDGEKTHIYVLTAAEDHGWTGSVATFAKEKVEEINSEGTYEAEVITSADANEQITKIEDIVAGGKENIAVVIQPMDDTVQSAIQQLVDAGIPYVAFDRIIDAVADSAVSNVKGDNAGIGAGAAAYFVSLGMQPQDEVYVYEGDTSSVTTLRDEGFTQYLLGEAEFDGETIPEDQKWTEEDLDAITYSGAMNWSRSDTKESYESLMGDASNASIKWFYAQDDELAMGILEALSGGGISDATKEAIFAARPVITGCGGIDEYYEVLRGNSYQDIVERLDGVMSVTYSPAMIQTAIQDMIDYLNGEEVEKDHVIDCENVVPENVDNYPSF